MTNDNPIFGLRFGSNADLIPTQEDLSLFLASTKKSGRRELHGKDLVKYDHLLEELAEFESGQAEEKPPQNLRDKIFYGVLGHSQFITPALKLAVEQYKYHLQALSLLDFRKPTAFIATAEKEMGRLNPKKKDEAAKLARLRGMVEERKQLLDALTRHRATLVQELGFIVRYIRDGLVKIVKLCEASIVILVEFHLSQQEEKRLVEEIREQFKERLRDSLHQGLVSRQELEIAKRDVGILSKELSALLREDIYSLTGLYEAIHGHAREIIHEIDVFMAEIDRKKTRSRDEEQELYESVERVLVALVSKYHLSLKMSPVRSATADERMLLDKRMAIVDRLFELVKKERRARKDRRLGEDRRKFNDPNWKGPERRAGNDRRSGRNRRA